MIKWLYDVCDLRDEARRPCGDGLIMTYDDLLYVSVQCTVDDSPFVHCKSFFRTCGWRTVSSGGTGAPPLISFVFTVD